MHEEYQDPESFPFIQNNNRHDDTLINRVDQDGNRLEPRKYTASTLLNSVYVATESDTNSDTINNSKYPIYMVVTIYIAIIVIIVLILAILLP